MDDIRSESDDLRGQCLEVVQSDRHGLAPRQAGIGRVRAGERLRQRVGLRLRRHEAGNAQPLEGGDLDDLADDSHWCCRGSGAPRDDRGAPGLDLRNRHLARGPRSWDRLPARLVMGPRDRHPDDVASRHSRGLQPVGAVADDRDAQAEAYERCRGLLDPRVDRDVVADEHDDVGGVGLVAHPLADSSRSKCRGHGDSVVIGSPRAGARRARRSRCRRRCRCATSACPGRAGARGPRQRGDRSRCPPPR